MTHSRLIDITIISENIAPHSVHNSPFLIVYKKLRIRMIGTHYGLSVCCVYTLANQKINYSQNCCTNFSDTNADPRISESSIAGSAPTIASSFFLLAFRRIYNRHMDTAGYYMDNM
jgi:hypothetical protein